jgi:hypothetical protein
MEYKSYIDLESFKDGGQDIHRFGKMDPYIWKGNKK